MTSESWPPLPLASWRDTCETLHRYAQIVGKIQLATTPRVCHFWNVALNVTARGLSTAALHHQGHIFEIELDLVEHALLVRATDGQERSLRLEPRTVADFYREVMSMLDSLGIHVEIWEQPVELASDVIPFSQDRMHGTYEPEWATRFWRVLLGTAEMLGDFRSRFIGKASPVGFYWGTFDLAAMRYSGRRAPDPPKGVIEGEAFSHEVSEVGFWPGDVRYDQAAFYAMHAPPPSGYAETSGLPRGAAWNPKMNCFLLPYEAVRAAAAPREMVLDFWQRTYAAGAELAHWNRAELERAP